MLTNRPANNQQAPIWMGLLVMAVGVLPIALGAEPSAGVPVWVLYAACSVFILGGLAIISPVLSPYLGLAIILIFAGISTWIGFSPGDKNCSSSVSFGFFTRSNSASSCGGFKIVAVFIWILLGGILLSALKKVLSKKNPSS